MNLGYRKDIDGLRAISVLAVLLNHAGIGLFSGGYIGVDIFFVISGYLITSIIVREIQSNQFSLARFYERRIRRILPALLVVATFTLVTCAIIYDAEKFKDFGKSVVATALFVSNINFWKEAGYFDAPSQLKPLLHTWSLAVEEQFYIVYPLFMFVLYRFAKKPAPFILAGTAILSFGFAVYATFDNPSAAFYFSHLRAWELFVGGILAVNLIPAEFGGKYSNLIGGVGFALIAIPIFLYTESTEFPGLSALTPVLGAAFILFSGTKGGTLVARFLSLSPLVFIGKISYSLYLWHWPLVIFVKYYMITPMSPVELGLLIVVTILISALSWRFVETPFRSKQFLSTRQIFAFGASGMTLMLVAGSAVYYFDGFPDPQDAERLAQESRRNKVWLFKECDINHEDITEFPTPCIVGKKSQVPSFMIMGDSHTPALGKAIYSSAEEASISGYLTYAPGCSPLLDISRPDPAGDVSCNDFLHMALAYINEHPEIKTVILASRWTFYLEESGHMGDILHEASAGASREHLFALGLERTVRTITEMNRNVVMVAPIPEVEYNVPAANFIAGRTGRDINELIAPTLDEYLSRNQRALDIIESLKGKYRIQVVEPWKILCAPGICRVVIDNVPLYNDGNHLSVFGSELIAPVFQPLFESMKQASK